MPDVARTLDLPSGQRFEYWKHVLSNTFVPLEVWSPGGGDDFRGLLRGCELGSLRIIEVSAEAHTARRTARLVKAAPAGCYKIGLQLRGSSVLIQDGREAILTPGDFTLYDTDRPHQRGSRRSCPQCSSRRCLIQPATVVPLAWKSLCSWRSEM